MEEQSNFPIHEKVEIGILLALVGGFLDAYTYFLRGGVFANAQTGNMVLFGISAAQGNWEHMLYYFLPVLAFFLGVIVTEWIRTFSTHLNVEQWRHIILLFETAILFIIGFLPLTVPDAVVNITVSFVCSMQVQSFRKLAGTPFATTMCTGNLRSATEQIFLWITQKNHGAAVKARRYLTIILFFCIGAFLGCLLTDLWQERSIWLCCILLLLVQGCMFYWDSKAKRQTLPNS